MSIIAVIVLVLVIGNQIYRALKGFSSPHPGDESSGDI